MVRIVLEEVSNEKNSRILNGGDVQGEGVTGEP